MEISRKSCRLCLSETDFNTSLFSHYCHRTNMLDKIMVCLKIVIEESDVLNTICFKCADTIEKFYEFTSFIKSSQGKLNNHYHKPTKRRIIDDNAPSLVNRRHVTSYVREQVYDADYTFSFLEIPNNEEKKEKKSSSPFFSYFTPTDKQENVWKTPKVFKRDERESERTKRISKEKPRHLSRDLFESQSQGDDDPKPIDWKLTPDDNIVRRVREKCFGKIDF